MADTTLPTSLFGVIGGKIFLLDPVLVLVSLSLVNVGLDWYIFLGCVKFALIGIMVKTGGGVQVITVTRIFKFVPSVGFPQLSLSV